MDASKGLDQNLGRSWSREWR